MIVRDHDAQRKAIDTQDLVVRIELLEQQQRPEAAQERFSGARDSVGC